MQRCGDDTFLGDLKSKHPTLWYLIEKAARDGLFVLDPEIDAISPTNRLLATCPSLHSIIATLVDDWADGRFRSSEQLASVLRRILEADDHATLK